MGEAEHLVKSAEKALIKSVNKDNPEGIKISVKWKQRSLKELN